VSRVVSKLRVRSRTNSRCHNKIKLNSGSTFSGGREAGSAVDILLKEREKRERWGSMVLLHFKFFPLSETEQIKENDTNSDTVRSF